MVDEGMVVDFSITIIDRYIGNRAIDSRRSLMNCIYGLHSRRLFSGLLGQLLTDCYTELHNRFSSFSTKVNC